jgi:LuxR family transcriptional regulator/LuxR family quorum-sensing system transcriptional regulator SolR
MTLDRFQKKFGLTQRERQTAGLLASGQSQKDIAGALGISTSAVKFHLTNLRRKMNVPSMISAAVKISVLLRNSGLL